MIMHQQEIQFLAPSEVGTTPFFLKLQSPTGTDVWYSNNHDILIFLESHTCIIHQKPAAYRTSGSAVFLKFNFIFFENKVARFSIFSSFCLTSKLYYLHLYAGSSRFIQRDQVSEIAREFSSGKYSPDWYLKAQFVQEHIAIENFHQMSCCKPQFDLWQVLQAATIQNNTAVC